MKCSSQQLYVSMHSPGVQVTPLKLQQDIQNMSHLVSRLPSCRARHRSRWCSLAAAPPSFPDPCTRGQENTLSLEPTAATVTEIVRPVRETDSLSAARHGAALSWSFLNSVMNPRLNFVPLFMRRDAGANTGHLSRSQCVESFLGHALPCVHDAPPKSLHHLLDRELQDGRRKHCDWQARCHHLARSQ